MLQNGTEPVREEKTFNTSYVYVYFIFYMKFNVELIIRPDIRMNIRYPASTGYPAKSLSGASLPKIHRKILKIYDTKMNK
jgi:hypothetical protein